MNPTVPHLQITLQCSTYKYISATTSYQFSLTINSQTSSNTTLSEFQIQGVNISNDSNCTTVNQSPCTFNITFTIQYSISAGSTIFI